jgi:hypothetical protein
MCLNRELRNMDIFSIANDSLKVCEQGNAKIKPKLMVYLPVHITLV